MDNPISASGLLFSTPKAAGSSFDSSFFLDVLLTDKSNLAETYSLYISHVLEQYPQSERLSFSNFLAHVMRAAGGMHFVDPLFQWVLVNVCRSKKKNPIIFDEGFTGFWRFGTETAAELLSFVPDIACFAKLMTGGIIPLAATLATNAVFDSFIGDSKLKALMDGHSYSAHAMGCTAAAKANKWFKDPRTNSNIVSEGRSLRELQMIEEDSKD